MRDVMILLVAAAGIAVAMVVFGSPRRLGAAGSADGKRPAGALDLSVIIPARNEALSLPNALTSLTGAPVREIIVVDDHSSDGTAEIAASFDVTVITAPDLPAGWSGKNWACATGAAAASAPLLLFLDADVHVGAHALHDVVGVHAGSGGLVSVQPFHRTERRYEELSSIFNAVAVMGSGCFMARGSGRASAAFGPCLLMSRMDYERIGGHAAVRGEVVEDIALAIRARAAGLAVTARLGGQSMSFRMYPGGVRQLVQGWTKNIAMGARLAAPVPVAATVLWVAALAAVAVAATTGVIDWIAGAGPPVAALAAWVMMILHLRWVLSRLGSFRWSTSILYVVPLAAFVAVFIRSGWSALRRADVQWRGRRIASRTTHSGAGPTDETMRAS